MEFRPMRRFKQALEQEECMRILREGSYGVLSLIGDGGYPYGVPLNYFYANNRIYFHGAKEGHKIDAMKGDARASFCVVEKSDVVPERFLTHFRSVIAFGKMSIASDEEAREIAFQLGMRFNPDKEAAKKEVEKEKPSLACFYLEMEHLSGKEALELLHARQGQ